jgi:Flp pilus assembly pilin Flp
VKKQLKQIGQGMTEYIIIVALIAIAAIAVYSIFGDVVREQVGGMAQELSGTDSTQDALGAAATTDTAAAAAGLGDYTDLEK